MNSRYYNYSINFNGKRIKHGDDYHKVRTRLAVSTRVCVLILRKPPKTIIDLFPGLLPRPDRQRLHLLPATVQAVLLPQAAGPGAQLPRAARARGLGAAVQGHVLQRHHAPVRVRQSSLLASAAAQRVLPRDPPVGGSLPIYVRAFLAPVVRRVGNPTDASVERVAYMRALRSAPY